MADRRFSHLERDRVEKSDEEAPELAPARFERRIERDDELTLDESGARTHFCRACEAENEYGDPGCFNCGAPLNGPGQGAFDEVKRRELAALREENQRALARARAVEAARSRHQAERAAARPAATPRQTAPLGLDPSLALAVVVVCLFATVSATLHLFLSAVWAEVPWSVLAEVAIASVLTWVVFTVLQGGRASG